MPSDDLLRALGIKTEKQKLALRRAYPRDTLDKDINRELQELIVMRKIARLKEAEMAKELGIPFTSNMHKGGFKRYTNEFEMSRTLSSNTGSFYDGRKVETHLQGTFSNSDFNPNHLFDMFNSVTKAAQDLATTDKACQNQMLQIREEFKGSILSLARDLARKPKGDELKALLERNVELHGVYISRLAIALWQTRHPGQRLPASFSKLSPFKSKEQKDYEKCVKDIQQKEIYNTSQIKRPIMMHIYKQKTSPDITNVSEYIVVTSEPRSDISSADRSFAKTDMFSNVWNVKIEVVRVTSHPNGKVTYKRKLAQDQYTRSSSIDRITYGSEARTTHENDLRELEKRELVYENFKALVIREAKELLIRRVNNDENIDGIIIHNEALIKESIETLLSPMLPKHHRTSRLLAKIAKPLAIKTVFESEDEQLRMTEYCLQRITEDTILSGNENPLRFSNEQKEEILSRTKSGTVRLTSEQLSKIRIKYSGLGGNFAVNKLGKARLERLDFYRYIRKYFIKNNTKRRMMIAHFLEQQKSRGYDHEINTLIGIFRDKKTIRVANKITEFMEENGPFLIKHRRISKILKLYVQLENNFFKIYRKNRIASNYLALIKDKALLNELDYKIRATCKSGVDRTGLLGSFIEGMARQDPTNVDYKLLEENVLLAMKHGPNRAIKSHNILGCHGTQVNPNTIKGWRKLGKFLSEQRFDQIGKMSKSIFAAARSTGAFNDAQEMRVGATPKPMAFVFNYRANKQLSDTKHRNRRGRTKI